MKKIQYKKTFLKQFKKLKPEQKEQFFSRLDDFLQDPYIPYLRYHSLKWWYLWYKSINISGDLRALFKEEWDSLIIFFMIWTHSELY
jgi:mRNA-degrading endonuclease YafQ of YafQ-DinJ toxin-antitoxin module